MPDPSRASPPGASRPPAPADVLEELRRVLLLEREKGYTDRAVVGGLDRYLSRWRERAKVDIPGSSGKDPAAPWHPRSSYAALDPKGRATWIEGLLRWLDQKKDASLSAPRQRQRSSSHWKARTTPQGEATLTLASPLTQLPGVKGAFAAKLHKLGLQSIQDLLFFYPRRYQDFSRIQHVSELVVGQEQSVVVTVWEAHERALGQRMRGTEAIVGDETGNLRAVWFNQPFLAKVLTPGKRVVLSGKVGLFRGQRVMQSPEWEPWESEELLHTGRLVPVYPLTEGLFPKQVRRLVKGVVDRWAAQVPDALPEDVRKAQNLLPLATALQQIHFPDSWESQRQGQYRLAFEELFVLQLAMLQRKRQWQEELPGHPLTVDQHLFEDFTRSLSFSLTGAQRRVLKEIQADLAKPKPMARLLQGEVGSGKTVVAVAALLVAVANGFQAALMAPTEILAEQHYTTLRKLYQGLEGTTHRPQLALLTGSMGKEEKQTLHRAIAQGVADIVIGTHALIQEEVTFRALGLVVIDEQHRFGVLQRAALREKGFHPHVLVMTATPIPRTLALTLYGDLDLSLLDEMPPGRREIKTKWLAPHQRQAGYRFLRRQVEEGHQAFVICPLVEESEKLEAKAALEEYRRLSQEVFPDLRLGLLHGRMRAPEKERVMRQFKEGHLHILVSTPVVEVGIDVPNATVMLIEGADRFGLAQLHQFRGRVGRSEHQSYCLLLAESPSDEARRRLEALERTQDGIALAEEDLRLRGPGEFFGLRQSGLPDLLRLANLLDLPLVQASREAAENLLNRDPTLQAPEHRLLAERLAHLAPETIAERS